MNTYLLVYLIGAGVAFFLMALLSDDNPGTADFRNTLISALLWPLTWPYALAIAVGRKLGLRK